MKKSKSLILNSLNSAGILYVVFLLLSLAFLNICYAEPFSTGEKLEYKIYASGFSVGHQTIEVYGTKRVNGRNVWVIKGRSKTSPFLSIFYRLDDKWEVFIDKETLLPIIVKKDVLEGKRKDYLIYRIDQNKKLVVISNRSGKKIKEIKYKNKLFDLFSLIYYFRSRPEMFGSDFVFDFLEEKSVRTVHFKKDKDLDEIIPTISRRKPVKAISITQIGGIGINIIVSRDQIRLPLKMVVPSKLPGNKKLNVIFSIHKFFPGDLDLKVPSYYKSIIVR